MYIGGVSGVGLDAKSGKTQQTKADNLGSK